ncbi:hypothetical protein AGDE_08095 [Angomonas deanei]|uniref:Probable Zinc-ribbon domain containing protein, putative n=1 Tax=Angomonas deanei TaxID=59799 RepID=A0A7G2CI87_9TRYP|nr:hypothetical protein AGDE_08095 [Angomonas deanei]CAD2219075.1 Probable Zinc-ribbon domain containing protein, putative [Angomonas deanei]|eukprot:EPY33997.1 hypothetical protein AGDE_08095 [Angomonas deanei]
MQRLSRWCLHKGVSCSKVASDASSVFCIKQLPQNLRDEFDHAESRRELTWLFRQGSPDKPQNAVEITPRSALKVIWKCKTCSEKFVARPCDRVSEQAAVGCPRCNANSGVNARRLTETHPIIAAQWCLEKNTYSNNISQPDLRSVSPDSSAQVWWSCPHCERTWLERINNRVSKFESQRTKYGPRFIPLCSACSSQGIESRVNGVTQARRPQFLSDDKNLLSEARLLPHQDPVSISLSADIVLQWTCGMCAHSYSASVANRALRHERCPQCSGGVTTPYNALLIQRPDVVKEISATISKKALQKLSIFSDMELAFVCRECLSIYTMSVKARCLVPEGTPACPKCFRSASKSLTQTGSDAKNITKPRSPKGTSSDLLEITRNYLRRRDRSLRN